VFHISVWGAWSIVWGVKPTKGPVATGLVPCQVFVCNSVEKMT